MILRDIATKLIVFNGENAQLFWGTMTISSGNIGWDDEPKAKKKEDKEKRVDVLDAIPRRAKSQKKRDRSFA